jgi:hypothetical protein
MEEKTYRTAEDYFQEALVDLKFDETTIQEYMISLGRKRMKWGRYIYNEERNTKMGEQALASIYKKWFHYYMYGDKTSKEDIKIDKKFIDIYIKAQDDYKSCELKLAEQKNKEKFLNDVAKNLEQQTFVVNNFIKHLLYQAGGN